MDTTVVMVGQFAVIALLLLALVLERSNSKMRHQLHDAWVGELNRTAAKESALLCLKAAHAELQHAFMLQGKALTLALAAAKAAERVQ